MRNLIPLHLSETRPGWGFSQRIEILPWTNIRLMLEELQVPSGAGGFPIPPAACGLPVVTVPLGKTRNVTNATQLQGYHAIY